MAPRRHFRLPVEDEQFLDDYGLSWETVVDGSPWLLIHDWPTPKGYTEPKVTVAVRIETGYPDVALDMVYVLPHLKRADARPIGCADALQPIEGQSFQRWSRHRTPQNPWVPGVDNIGSHIFLIEDWFEREFEK